MGNKLYLSTVLHTFLLTHHMYESSRDLAARVATHDTVVGGGSDTVPVVCDATDIS